MKSTISGTIAATALAFLAVAADARFTSRGYLRDLAEDVPATMSMAAMKGAEDAPAAKQKESSKEKKKSSVTSSKARKLRNLDDGSRFTSRGYLRDLAEDVTATMSMAAMKGAEDAPAEKPKEKSKEKKKSSVTSSKARKLRNLDDGSQFTSRGYLRDLAEDVSATMSMAAMKGAEDAPAEKPKEKSKEKKKSSVTSSKARKLRNLDEGSQFTSRGYLRDLAEDVTATMSMAAMKGGEDAPAEKPKEKSKEKKKSSVTSSKARKVLLL